MGGAIFLFPYIAEVRVAGWGFLFLVSVSFYVLEAPAKTLAEVFGNAAGLGSQPLRWRMSTTCDLLLGRHTPNP